MKALLLFIIIVIATSAKSVPSAISRQDDIPPASYGEESASGRVLVVSRAGDFKEAVVTDVINSLIKESLRIDVRGVQALKDTDPTEYNAIVIINTCMAWQIDNNVQQFFRDNPTCKSVILLTTSSDPVSCGRGRHIPEGIHAISSASETKKIATVTNEIIAAVKRLLTM